MTPRNETRLWIAQRASAAVLAVCVIVHLATIIYAVQGGRGAAEILGRTRGNVPWALFYCVFVAAVALHAPIGLRSVFREWLGWRTQLSDAFLLGFSAAIFILGMRAVAAVFG
jgi:fumarate reductase subunit C